MGTTSTTSTDVIAEQLVVRRGRQVVLRQLCCEIGGPGVTVIVGVNGSGKTTLLQTLAGLLRPESGRLEVLGHDATRLRRRGVRGRLGYAEQSPQFPSERGTVVDALNHYAWCNRVRKVDRQQRIATLLSAFDLAGIAAGRVGELSGGTRQRLAVALSVLHDPDLVLLDEPTAGIDVEHRSRVRDALRHLARDRTIVMTSHVAEDVSHLADNVVVVHEGAVIMQTTAEGFLDLGDPIADSRFESALLAAAAEPVAIAVDAPGMQP